MSTVLQLQREKINEILQIFEGFGNQTQESISINEQIKSKEAERLNSFDIYLTNFEKTFAFFEISLKKAYQERENLILKVNQLAKTQRNLKENQDFVLNSLSNQMDMIKFLIESDKKPMNWTNYITILALFGVLN